MGNSWNCCCSSQPHVLSPPPEHEPAVSLPSPPVPAVSSPTPSIPSVSSPPPSIDSIKESILQVDPTQQIDLLISFIEYQLQRIKASSKEASTSSSTIHLDSVASNTNLAAKIIDTISTEAEKFKGSDIAKEMGSVALRAVKAVGESHWIFLGLSVVASALERCVQVRAIESKCIELLEKLVELAKDVKKLREAIPDEREKLLKAVGTVVEGAVICCDYIGKGKVSRYWTTSTVESQLSNTSQSIRDITQSLHLALDLDTNQMLKKQFTHRLQQSPFHLLDIQPVGIEKQVEEVTKLLDMDGTEPALAVVLCGFGGVGKSTLAASAIQSLNWTSADFKFCRVIIDDKIADKTSHIIKLQQDIIRDFGGEKLDLRNAEEGRIHLQQVIQNKSCFLFIDNVVDKYYIKQLLPRDLSMKNLEKHKNMSMENLEKQKTKLRIFVTSREKNLRPEFNITCKEHDVHVFPDETAERLLRETILQHEGAFREDFDERGFMNAVARACRGVPLLLSVFGNHLRAEREQTSYKEVLEALQQGNLDSFRDEDLSEPLFFVYRKIKDEEEKDTFLDICKYFHGWQWNLVAHIVDSGKLEALHNKMLIKKSDSGDVIVHDILRLMGIKEAKQTRISNYDEFLQTLEEDESNLKNVKGISLCSDKSVTTLETRHLHAMCHSLRVLMLGDWVNVDGSLCQITFESLRYLSVGDVSAFPFEDASKLEKLTVFFNRSKHGMNLQKLPRSLKVISQEVADPACHSFETLPLQNLTSLQKFTVQARKSVNLPELLQLPASLVDLQLNSCVLLPKDFNNLTALECLILDKCDVESLPQGFQNLKKLKHVSMEHCSKLTSLPEEIGSLSSMTCLRLRGCTLLQKLPDLLVKWSALEELSMGECENLRELPQGFGGLSSLKKLDLTGCVNVQKLPDSFGKLRIESLTLQSMLSLVELPHGIGNMTCLTSLELISCDSLRTLPNSFVQLESLQTLKIRDCNKLVALPADFGQLSSLNKMTVKNCSDLKELPHGFQTLPALKTLRLKDCSSLENLPSGFWELICLEELTLQGLRFSTLPDGFGKLQRLQFVGIYYCFKLETLSNDFENLATLFWIYLRYCRKLDGAAMGRIVKLQQCYLVDISGSAKLMDRWEKLREEEEHPMLVCTQRSVVDEEEWSRAARVALFGGSGKCMEMDSNTHELMERSTSSLFDVGIMTTAVVIALPVLMERHHHQLIQRLVGVAIEKARTASSGQLRIVYVRRVKRYGERTTEEEEDCFRQILVPMPKGSCAILSSEIRRHNLIMLVFFDSVGYDSDNELACCMMEMRVDDEGNKFCDYKENFGEDDISGEVLHSSESRDEKNENSNSIGKCIESICAGDFCETAGPSQSQSEPEESMFAKFIQTLKENNADHLIDPNLNKVGLDELEGKTVGIFMCDLNTPECIKLQQIYKDIKLKDSNFEGVWIPLLKNKHYGHGTYIRSIQEMPWAALPDPNLVKVENKNPHCIIFDKEGSIGNSDALSVMMAWGASAEAYPFTHDKINEFISNLHVESSLEFLLYGIDPVKERSKNKLIFLYAEPPSQKLKMKSKLEKLARLHRNCEIVYVGYFCGEENDVATIKEVYEDATQQMYWPKLSFWDMIMFWYRCKYLLEEVTSQLNLMVEEFKKFAKFQYTEKRWLVLLDSDGVVTRSGNEVVDMMCKTNDGQRDKVDVMMEEELMESLKSGKCSEIIQTFFKDEILSHPLHPQHHLLIDNRLGHHNYYCNSCTYNIVITWDQRRRYRCHYCDWDLCVKCWEVFVKGKVEV